MSPKWVTLLVIDFGVSKVIRFDSSSSDIVLLHQLFDRIRATNCWRDKERHLTLCVSKNVWEIHSEWCALVYLWIGGVGSWQCNSFQLFVVFRSLCFIAASGSMTWRFFLVGRVVLILISQSSLAGVLQSCSWHRALHRRRKKEMCWVKYGWYRYNGGTQQGGGQSKCQMSIQIEEAFTSTHYIYN